MDPLRRCLLAAVLCSWVAAAQTSAQSMSPAAERIDEAASLEADARYGAAARTLAPLVALYPEDYALRMRVAWDHYRGAEYDAALAHYRVAAELSDGSSESHLGLGWTLLSLGRCDEAFVHFEAIPERAAERSLADEGAAVCAAPMQSHVAIELGAVGHYYVDHPWLRSGVAGFVSADAVVSGVLLLGATYRLTALEGLDPSAAPGPGPGTGRSEYLVSLQNEVHASVGVRFGIADVRVAYGVVVSDVEQLLSPMHAAGMLLRLRPFGEIVLEAGGTFSNDEHVLRLAPSWWLPLTPWLSLRPGGSVQWAVEGARAYGTGELTALVHGAVGSAWLGGRVGTQWHPYFLEQAVIYNVSDEIREGVWAGGAVALGAGVSLRLDYELQRRLTADALGNEQQAWAHYGVLRLRWESQ